MQNLSKKLLTATIVLITSVAVLLGVSTFNVKANTELTYIKNIDGDIAYLDSNNTYLLTNDMPDNVDPGQGITYYGVYYADHFDTSQYRGPLLNRTDEGLTIANFMLSNSENFETEFKSRFGVEYYLTFGPDGKFTFNEMFGEQEVFISENNRVYIKVLDDVEPAISGEHTVINNIDSPYTLDRIKEIANLKAFDSYYGDITDDIEVVHDTYSDNKSKVGTYEIEYKVTNASDISTNFILLVANKDLTKPVISGPGTSSMSYTEEFVLSNLIAKFTVTDNHDTNVKLELESTTHEPGVPGVYVFKFFAKDSSNNIATFNHTLTIVDDVKPTITDTNEGVIQVNWRDNVTNEILLMHLSAHDAIDGDLTSSIQVIENNIKNEVGNYTVKYQVTDSAGNSSLYTRTYKVVTTDAPVFWVSANLLLISEVNALTNQQLADELASYEGINMASHMMLLNEYEGNENTPGTYMVRIAINDNKGEEHIVERTIEVFADDELPELELSIWKKIGNFIVSVWEIIVKVFTWIWNAIKWVFDFVFGWIN